MIADVKNKVIERMGELGTVLREENRWEFRRVEIAREIKIMIK